MCRRARSRQRPPILLLRSSPLHFNPLDHSLWYVAARHMCAQTMTHGPVYGSLTYAVCCAMSHRPVGSNIGIIIAPAASAFAASLAILTACESAAPVKQHCIEANLSLCAIHLRQLHRLALLHHDLPFERPLPSLRCCLHSQTLRTRPATRTQQQPLHPQIRRIDTICMFSQMWP